MNLIFNQYLFDDLMKERENFINFEGIEPRCWITGQDEYDKLKEYVKMNYKNYLSKESDINLFTCIFGISINVLDKDIDFQSKIFLI